MSRILAVDDDRDVLDALGRVLRMANHEVILTERGRDAILMLDNQLFDLLILDITMPEMDGITICRQLRRESRYITLPIMFLTARGTTDDVVVGLDAGADDYVVKPFELQELRARVDALLRRRTREKQSETVLRLSNLTLNSETYQLLIGDSTIQLTSTEHRLLRYLMLNPNKPLSPSILLQEVWEYPPNTGDPDLVRAHVRNLRQKIELGNERKYIRTIHGVGYMIADN